MDGRERSFFIIHYFSCLAQRPRRNIRLDTSNIGYVGLRHETIQ
jgi:hypothetical protein